MLIPFHSHETRIGRVLAKDASPSLQAPKQRKLHIAFIAPEDRRTGSYFRYHNLAVALRQLGHRVTVYSQSSSNRLRETRDIRDGVPYRLSATLPGNRWMIPPTNPATVVRRILAGVERADIYHLFQPFPTAALTWLWLKKWRPGLFVYDWDDFWINEEFGLKDPKNFQAWWTARWIGRLEKRLPSRSDLTTTVSRPLADLAREWGCRRTAVVSNGMWPQPPRDKGEARAALNLKPDALYAGLMGWSGEIDWCLEALRKYAPVFPNLRLAIAGRDPSANLSSYEDIRSRIDYLGVLPDEKFVFFNAAIDLGLVPMRASEFNRYRLPFKLTDHLAGGTPVLCSRIGDAGELAEQFDGITACEPSLDSWLETFHDTVATLCKNPRASSFSLEPLLKRLSWLRIARKIDGEYRSALASKLLVPEPLPYIHHGPAGAPVNGFSRQRAP